MKNVLINVDISPSLIGIKPQNIVFNVPKVKSSRIEYVLINADFKRTPFGIKTPDSVSNVKMILRLWMENV